MNEEFQQDDQITRVVEPEIIKMGMFQRLSSIFVSPGELMQNIKTYPIISVPLIASIIIGLISVPIMQQVAEMLNQQLSIISIERFGVDLLDIGGVDEYGDAAVTAVMDAVMIVGFAVSALLGPLIAGAIYAVSFWIMCKIAKGTATLAQLFSMSLHIYVLYIIGSIIASSLMVLTGNFLDMTSLAAVVMPGGNISMIEFNILSSVSIFTVWTAVLYYIGVKTLNDFSNFKAGVIAFIAFAANTAVLTGSMMLPIIMWDRLMAAGVF